MNGASRWLDAFAGPVHGAASAAPIISGNSARRNAGRNVFAVNMGTPPSALVKESRDVQTPSRLRLLKGHPAFQSGCSSPSPLYETDGAPDAGRVKNRLRGRPVESGPSPKNAPGICESSWSKTTP